MLQIAKELNVIDQSVDSRQIKLPDLREKMLIHPAFSDNHNTNLEKLAFDYNVKIIWCPKYHCELNPIEGVWCDSKKCVRKNNDQNFSNLNNLIADSLKAYEDKKLNIKLWYRFWQALEMYENESSYQEVLQTLFGAKSSDSITTHKKNKHFNTILSY